MKAKLMIVWRAPHPDGFFSVERQEFSGDDGSIGSMSDKYNSVIEKKNYCISNNML